MHETLMFCLLAPSLSPFCLLAPSLSATPDSDTQAKQNQNTSAQTAQQGQASQGGAGKGPAGKDVVVISSQRTDEDDDDVHTADKDEEQDDQDEEQDYDDEGGQGSDEDALSLEDEQPAHIIALVAFKNDGRGANITHRRCAARIPLPADDTSQWYDHSPDVIKHEVIDQNGGSGLKFEAGEQYELFTVTAGHHSET